MSRTAPSGQRHGELDQAVHRADQLEAAAADVGHEGALAGQAEVMRHRAVGERRLGLGVDDPERDVELLADPPDERRAVVRLAHGGGGHGGDPLARRGAGRPRACGPASASARSMAALVEAAGGGEPGRQAGLVLHLVDDGEAGRRDRTPPRAGGSSWSRRRWRRCARGWPARGPGLDAGRAITRPRPPGRRRRRGASPRSSAWCLIDLPSTRKTTSSPMLVARSATRSRLRLTRKSSMPAPIMCGSSIMCVSRMRNTERCRASTLSSRRQTSRPAGGVAPDEGLERVGQHVARQPGHLDDLGLRRDRPRLASAARPTGRC